MNLKDQNNFDYAVGARFSQSYHDQLDMLAACAESREILFDAIDTITHILFPGIPVTRFYFWPDMPFQSYAVEWKVLGHVFRFTVYPETKKTKLSIYRPWSEGNTELVEAWPTNIPDYWAVNGLIRGLQAQVINFLIPSLKTDSSIESVTLREVPLWCHKMAGELIDYLEIIDRTVW